MRIGQIDLPAPVLNAQEAGTLVIFAGAGVSMPAPSNYPNFVELAKWVGRASGAAPDWDPAATGEQIDAFLGRLYSRGISVHEMVRTRLSDPRSQPTELHHDLLSLFRSERDVRIVTTNLDTHFSTAAGTVFAQPMPTYTATALPAARRSQGIVYLHSSVAQEDPADLVLTDVDFGRAYLTEGWATRFLMDLFSTSTVLFVGFSHNDPILRYLGRGLPPRTSRYALTEQGRNEHWALLGVTPVEYPPVSAADRHGALIASVRAWAQLTRMDALDKEQRLRTILGRPPGVDPEETDFVRSSLADLATARFFARHARGIEWLDWLDRQGMLDQFFGQTKDPADLERVLAQWIADRFLEDGDHALGLLQKKGKPLGPTLWWAVARALAFAAALPPPRVLAGWTAVLLDATAYPNSGDMLVQLVRRSRIPEDLDTAVLLLEELMRPALRLRPFFGFGGSGDAREYDVEVALRAREAGLSEAWEALKPHLGLLAPALARLVAASIERAHRLLRSVEKAHDQWDPVSFGLAAIASHRQNSPRREMGPVIDIARDAVEELLRFDPAAARRLRDEWEDAGSPVLRRVAVHALTEDTSTPADEKVRRVLRNGWLFSTPLKPEVFRLLQLAYPAAQERVRHRLLARARKGPPATGRTAEGRRTRDYEIYNLLGWLAQAAPDCAATRTAFEEFRSAHPDFGPRAHPDLDWYVDVGRGTGWVTHVSPLSVEELLAEPPHARIECLLTFRGSPFEGPDREGLLENVAAAVSQNFAWGAALADELLKIERPPAELWAVVLRSWRRASLVPEQWRRVLAVARQVPVRVEVAHELSEFLVGFVASPAADDDTDLREQAMALADDVWAAAEQIPAVVGSSGGRESGGRDWLMEAINHPAGKLAEFWINLAAKLRAEAGDSWGGLPDRLKEVLNAVLAGTTYASSVGRTYVATQLLFLYGADPSWTRERLIPLFDWTRNPAHAEQMWDGHLSVGKFSDGLLTDFLPLYEGAVAHVHTLREQLRNQFYGHLAAIALLSSVHPLESGWLARFITSGSEAARAGWARAVREVLEELSGEAAHAAWTRWLREYWLERVRGVPVSLTPEEAGYMAEWTTDLGDAYEEAVSRVLEGPVPILESDAFYHRLNTTELPQQYPDAVARLMAHVLGGEGDPFYACTEATAIVDKVSSAGADSAVVRSVRGQLARLGCV